MLLINKLMSEFALNLYWQPLKDGNHRAQWSDHSVGTYCKSWALALHWKRLVLPARFSEMVRCILVFNGCFHSSTEEDTIDTLAQLPHNTQEKPKHNRQLQRPKSESEMEYVFLHFLQRLRKPRHPVGVWAKFAISQTWEQRKCQKPVH